MQVTWISTCNIIIFFFIHNINLQWDWLQNVKYSYLQKKQEKFLTDWSYFNWQLIALLTRFEIMIKLYDKSIRVMK